MTPIVVFDLGKVLVDFDYSIAAKKVAARCAKHIENLHGRLSAVRRCWSNLKPASSTKNSSFRKCKS